MTERDALRQELQALAAELEDRRKSLPAHSIRPHQLIELEELEEKIRELRKSLDRGFGQE